MIDLKLHMWAATVKALRSAPGSVALSCYLARRIFRVNIVNREHDHLWDETTLIMHKALRTRVKDGQRILDLGTGQIGVLALYCAGLADVDVLGVDINESYVANARRTAEASGRAGVRFVTGDWFSNVDGRYDLIISNIPYIPTCVGIARKDPCRDREVWDGGDDGCAHARIILAQVRDYLLPGGRLLMGANSLYVPKRTVEGLLRGAGGLDLVDIVRSVYTPSCVYVISPDAVNGSCMARSN